MHSSTADCTSDEGPSTAGKAICPPTSFAVAALVVYIRPATGTMKTRGGLGRFSPLTCGSMAINWTTRTVARRIDDVTQGKLIGRNRRDLIGTSAVARTLYRCLLSEAGSSHSSLISMARVSPGAPGDSGHTSLAESLIR
jgi:hypothetical protein